MRRSHCCGEALPGDDAIAMLGPVLGRGDLDTGRRMAQTNSRIGLVAMLAASTRRPERFHAHVCRINRDDRFIGVRYLDQRDCGTVPPTLLLFRWDSLHALCTDQPGQQTDVKAAQ